MPVIDTQGEIPPPIAGDLLVVEPYNGSPVPTDRLPVGVYYAQDNEFKAANWQDLAKILAPSLRKLLPPTAAPTVAETLTVDISVGENTFPHDLGRVPALVQFWQGEYLMVAGFAAKASASEIIVESPDIYKGIKINLLTF